MAEKSSKFTTKRIAIAAVFAAVICVLSPFSVPIGTVPISLGLFAVLLTGAVLKPIDAFLAVIVYILLGAAGLPIFSGGQGGLGVILGPTGGYIWSFPIVALVFALLKNRVKKLSWPYNSAVAFVSVIICYICGTFQFSLVMDKTVSQALLICVVPFVVFDIIKCFCAAIIGVKTAKIIDGITNS